MSSACASVAVPAMTTLSKKAFIAPLPHAPCNEAKFIADG
jgi:hypothetical protein